jgi:hypothetical protein
MALDYATLELLRQNHPAWRLLCAHHAPLVVSFLHRVDGLYDRLRHIALPRIVFILIGKPEKAVTGFPQIL